MLVFEGRKEGGAIDAVEGLGGPVEHLVEPQRAELGGVGEVPEELLQDGDAQVLGGLAPAKARLGVGVGVVLRPEHPGGKQAVEEGLHERRAEEVLAAFALEGHAQRLFERRARDRQGGQLAAFLDAGARLAGVAGEEPGEVLRRDDRHRAQHDAPQELGEALAVGGRALRGVVAIAQKAISVSASEKLSSASACAVGVVADQHELAVGGDQHLAVLLEVLHDLLALGDQRQRRRWAPWPRRRRAPAADRAAARSGPSRTGWRQTGRRRGCRRRGWRGSPRSAPGA